MSAIDRDVRAEGSYITRDMAADMNMTSTPLPTSAQTTSPPDRFYAPPATPDSRKIGGIIVGAVLGFASLAIGVYLLFKWIKARHRHPGTRRTGKKRANSDNARNGTLPQGRKVKNGPELPLHQLDGTYERPPRCPPARGSSTETLRDMYFTGTGSLSQWQICTRRSENCSFEDTYAQKSRRDTDDLPHATIGNSSSGRFAPSQDHHGNFTATISDIAHAASSQKSMSRLNSAKALPPIPVSEDFLTRAVASLDREISLPSVLTVSPAPTVFQPHITSVSSWEEVDGYHEFLQSTGAPDKGVSLMRDTWVRLSTDKVAERSMRLRTEARNVGKSGQLSAASS